MKANVPGMPGTSMAFMKKEQVYFFIMKQSEICINFNTEHVKLVLLISCLRFLIRKFIIGL